MTEATTIFEDAFKYGSIKADNEDILSYENMVIGAVITAIPQYLSVKQVANLLSQVGYELEQFTYKR